MTPEQRGRAERIVQALRSAAAQSTDSATGVRVAAAANDLDRLVREIQPR